MKNISLPLKLISLLSDGEYHVGHTLHMNQETINESIQTVQGWGVDIFTVPGKGYCLYEPLQLLDEKIIKMLLPTGKITVVPIIDSSNQYLIDRISRLRPGDACVAEYQEKGRGRRGRKWISPFGSNLYLSLYWQLKKKYSGFIGLSLMVSIVIAEKLQRLGLDGVQVKWPNDIYLKNRKLAGILIEMTAKNNHYVHVIIGLGVNLKMSKSRAGMINQAWINLQESDITIDRNTLAIELIDTLHRALRKFEKEGFSPFRYLWPKVDYFHNRLVKLLIEDRLITGIARGIDTHGAILIEKEGKIYSYLNEKISLFGL